uniref:Uncharacterized protein n=1 Tax=Romanomermis culicivorax TaxID=13658 RepID=A0A915I6Y9_ROMCU
MVKLAKTINPAIKRQVTNNKPFSDESRDLPCSTILSLTSQFFVDTCKISKVKLAPDPLAAIVTVVECFFPKGFLFRSTICRQMTPPTIDLLLFEKQGILTLKAPC